MLKSIKNQKGMTLVELLAVMVIVGIIAAIALPAIGGLMENTRRDAYISNATSVQEGARLFVVSNESIISQKGHYPVVITGTPSTTTGSAGSTVTSTTNYTWEIKAGTPGTQINDFVEDFNVYIENLVDPHTKGVFQNVTITIKKDVSSGELTYQTSIKGNKFQTPQGAEAKDARQLTRADVKTY